MASSRSLSIDLVRFTTVAGAAGSPAGASQTSDPGRVGFVVIIFPSQDHFGASRSKHCQNPDRAAHQLTKAGETPLVPGAAAGHSFAEKTWPLYEVWGRPATR